MTYNILERIPTKKELLERALSVEVKCIIPPNDTSQTDANTNNQNQPPVTVEAYTTKSAGFANEGASNTILIPPYQKVK